MIDRHRLLAGLSVIVALGVVAVIVGVNSSSSSSSTPAAGSGARGRSAGATVVERRNLVETDTESGTLGYAGTSTVYNRLGGTITDLPSTGTLIEPGGVLFRVDENPVVLLNGSTPAYRTLAAGVSDGSDILELNAALVALHDNPDDIVVDDAWQPATTAGVEALQASLGTTVTGRLDLGQAVFLAGPQLVASLDDTVGATSAADDRPSVDGGSTTFVGLTHTLTGTSAVTKSAPVRRASPRPSAGELTALLRALRAEIAALRASTAQAARNALASTARTGTGHSTAGAKRSSSGSASSGGGGSATPIMSTTSDRLVVTVDLPATAQGEARIGDRVSIELPSTRTVGGRVAAVSRVAQSGGSSGGSGGASGNTGGGSSSNETVPVTIRLLSHVGGAGLDDAAVSVGFSEARARHVLSVPVTALLAISGSSYAVQEAVPPHRIIRVATGLFAAGYVEVSGRGIVPGLQVTDSQG